MAKYTGPVCRLCRREGEKLFLKGERCYTSKCTVERREGGPGQHGKGRQQFSDYKVQLRAKQKVRRSYGVLEKKFRDYFKVAAKSKGVTGTELLQQLETRLDNIVYRLGFGTSRAHARQVVNHGHIVVNGKRVDIPSFKVRVGDVVEVREKSKKDLSIGAAVALGESRSIPEWLNLDREQFRGTVVALPTREQMPQSYQEQLIVELYSK
ncbi:30S ribosomal protein S4 [bacterium]|jgi:small subunit ribosomal protein S4|nr:30S ribosomal protein S4 [bacterium]